MEPAASRYLFLVLLASCGGGASSGPSTAPPVAARSAAGTPPLAPSALTSELKSLGLEPSALPPLDALDRAQMKGVMKLFSRSLGVPCTGCHATDFHAPTAKKRVAERMWNDFSRGYTFREGAPVFCDSCHQGKAEFLDRSNDEALGQWMDANFVKKLRHGGGAATCATCHGEPFDGHFLAKWTK